MQLYVDCRRTLVDYATLPTETVVVPWSTFFSSSVFARNVYKKVSLGGHTFMLLSHQSDVARYSFAITAAVRNYTQARGVLVSSYLTNLLL